MNPHARTYALLARLNALAPRAGLAPLHPPAAGPDASWSNVLLKVVRRQAEALVRVCRTRGATFRAPKGPFYTHDLEQAIVLFEEVANEAEAFLADAAPPPAPEAFGEDAPPKSEQEAPEEQSALEEKTNAELREMCKAAGLTGYSSMNKAELIAALS